MILSYADKETERLSRGERVRRFLPFERVALRKLRQLELAASINDLRIPLRVIGWKSFRAIALVSIALE